MMGAQRSSETSVLTKATQTNITEDGIIHIQCRGNIKTYTLVYVSSAYWNNTKMNQTIGFMQLNTVSYVSYVYIECHKIGLICSK
jgi:hypothetical protein